MRGPAFAVDLHGVPLRRPEEQHGAIRVLSDIRDAVLIVNPRAGSGRRMSQLDNARRILSRAGIETEFQLTAAPGEAMALARCAAERSRQLVIVCGGDGTVNEAVNGLAGSRVPLALLPAGTANVLAKELSIRWNLTRAARQLLGARLRRIALGLAIPDPSSGSPRYFISVGGAGADAALVTAVNPKIKDRAGILAYWQEGFRQLVRYNFPQFQVTTPQTSWNATLVIVGRARHYGGPFRITTGAGLFQDQFELAVITTRSRWQYLGYLPWLYAGQLRRVRHVHFQKTTSLRCLSLDAAPIQIQVDGEPAGRLPAEFRIVPDALTLAMPEPM
jgi:diacylglycerol kinase (ATP)